MSVRWGILGAARIADGVAQAIAAADGAKLAAVASRDPRRAAAFAAKHSCRAHASYEALLDDPTIDAVYVPVPTALHAEWALRCAEAGKPALVEKPFAMSAAEARRVFTAFAERSLPVGEALMYHFHPLTRRARALIADGALGPLRALRSTFVTAIAAPDDIRWRRETGGGALRDLGCYCVSVLRLLAGAEPTTLAAIQSEASAGVDAAFAGTLHFPGGALGWFGCAMRGAFDCSYEAIGDDGILRVDRGAMVAWPGEAFRIALARGDRREEIDVPSENHYRLMIESFSRAVSGIERYGIPPEETLANLEVMDQLLGASTPRRASATA
jgi:predicted dehydrogenase